MEKTDVLIIGGGPAAIITAVTGKVNYPEKEFTVVRNCEKAMIPCGIPYIFGTLNSIDENIMPDMPLEKAGVELIIGEAEKINIEKKTCALKDGKEIEYEKLVIATGSDSVVPGWLKGAELENVFTISKSMKYLDVLNNKLKDFQDVTVIGAGFIGVETSDELKKAGKNVTLVEKLDTVLAAAFDSDLGDRVGSIIKERGINVVAGTGVKEIKGKDKVENVILEDGREIKSDAVILAMGYSPNISLAKDADMVVSSDGFICVDEYMRTSDPDVFAVGDCAEKRDFITKKPARIMLASTATTEARIAGMNLYNISNIRNFAGTISIFSTAIGNDAFGVAGVTETSAERENICFVSGSFEGMDRHPGKLPDTKAQYVKLIALKDSGTVIGGAVAGSKSAGEIVNLLGFIIQNRMGLNSIITGQIGTHPLLTSAPTTYPLIKAAETAIKNM